MKKKLLILAGDGIGPEVMNEVKKIIAWFNKNKSTDFDITEELAGGISFDKHGTPITDKVMEVAMASDAVLLGAVGGPKWDKLEFSLLFWNERTGTESELNLFFFTFDLRLVWIQFQALNLFI